MKIAMLTSVSPAAPWAPLTTPNHAEYCLRHGYTFIARNLPYEAALADFPFLQSLLCHFDAVWCLDSDAVITNMNRRVEELPLGGTMNVCLEGLHDACPINCGSVIWHNVGCSTDWLLDELRRREPEWRQMTWVWQQWIAERLEELRDVVTVHSSRAFNSCHHGDKCLWEPGDFVYHPCGMPHPERMANIERRLGEVVM